MHQDGTWRLLVENHPTTFKDFGASPGVGAGAIRTALGQGST